MTFRRGITRLQPGQPVPAGQPKRYITHHGYVALRWLVAPACYVEVHEHRLNAGMPSSEMSVHHINGNKLDNRPENLQVVPPKTHARLHQSPSWDVDAAIAEYAAGVGLSALGRKYGVNPVTVLRAFRVREVSMRPTGSALKMCRNGHPFDGTYTWRGRTWRTCSICLNNRARKYRSERTTWVSTERSVR